MVRKFRVINPETGELVELHELPEESGGYPVKKKPTLHDERYMTVFLKGLRWAVAQRDLSGTDYRVLFANWLLPGNEEGWHTDHKRVAELIGVSEGQVLASTAKLIRHGMLLKPRKGWLTHMPMLSWRGTVAARNAAKAAFLAKAEPDE